MSATVSATLSSPFQASMDGDGVMDGHREPYGFDPNMYCKMPSSNMEEEQEEEEESTQTVVANFGPRWDSLPVARFGPRWDSLPGHQEVSLMASQGLSTMAMQQQSVNHPEAPLWEHHQQQQRQYAPLQSEDKEVLYETPPPMEQPLLEEPCVRHSVPPRPRFYSTPIREDEPGTTPVMLYGLEQPSEYAPPPPRRRLPALRPMSFFGGPSSSRPSSSHRNQPSSLSKGPQLQTAREPRSSLALKRLSTLLEAASPPASRSVPKAPPTEEARPIVSSTSSTLTSRSGVTVTTVDSDGATAPSPALSGSPASSIREPAAPAESTKLVVDPSPVPTVARADTETVDVPSGNNTDIALPPQPPLIRRKTAPDMNASDPSRENRPIPAPTKFRVPASLSSISKINLPKLPSMGHRTATRESEISGADSAKPRHRRASSINSSSSRTLAQSLQRPLPPPPLPHDYCSELFAEIQPDDIPTHTNYDQRTIPTTTTMAALRSSSLHPRGIRQVTNGDNRPGFHRSSTEQAVPSSRRRREHGHQHDKSSHRMTRVFSQFVN